MKLKKYNRLCKILFVASIGYLTISCSSNNSSKLSTFNPSIVQPAKDFTDPRDGSVYHCVRIGDQIWMTENLHYLPPLYNDDGCHTWGESNKYIGMTTEEYRDELWKNYEFKVDADIFWDPPRYPSIFPDVSEDDILNKVFEVYEEKEAELKEKGSDIVEIMARYKAGNIKKEKLYDIIKDRDPDFLKEYDIPSRFDLRKKLVFSESTIKVMAQKIFEEADKNNDGYKDKYGYLYSYEGALKAVPEGWRLPSDKDWQKLEISLGLSAKEAGLFEAWRGEGLATRLNVGGESKFNALPAGGNVYTKGAKKNLYVKKGQSWYFWSSTKYALNDSVNLAVFRMGSDITNKVWRGSTRLDNQYRDVTYSVRCVKDVK